MFRVLFLLALGVSVASCSTLNREECLSADWQLIGFNDGLAGRSENRLEQHREACAEYSVTPVLEEYLTGHYRGASRYCNAENGYQHARAGKAFNAICKGELKYSFGHGFALGQEARQQLLRVQREEKKLKQLQQQLRDTEVKVSEYEQALIADDKTRDQRYDLLQKLEYQQDRQIDLENRIQRRKRQVTMEQRYLEDLERDLIQQL